MAGIEQHFRIRLWGEVGLEPSLGSLSRRARALLAWLALQPSGGVDRARAAALLWPDRTDAQALANLRQLLHEHRWLASGAAGPLIVSRDRLALPAARFVSDHADLLSLTDKPSEFARSLSALTPPLLGGLEAIGDEFDRWLAFERSRREDQLALLVEALASKALQGKDLETARCLVDAWARLRPSDEAVVRVGLAIDAAAADGASAQRRMGALTTALSDELATAPSPATQRAFKAALDAVVTVSHDLGGSRDLDAISHRTRPPDVASSPRRSRSIWPALAVFVVLGAAVGVAWIAGSNRVSVSADQTRQAAEFTVAARSLTQTRTRAGYSRAVELTRAAITRDPNYAQAYVELAVALWMPAYWAEQDQPGARMRTKAEAIGYLDRALALQPGQPRALAVKGMVIGGPRGRELLERAAKGDPTDADTWNWTAEARQVADDFAGTLVAYGRALAISPQSPRIVSDYTSFAMFMGREDLANAAIARFAPTADGGTVRALQADQAYRSGRLAEAAALDLEALQHGPPDHWHSMTRLSHLARAIGDLRAARAVVETDPELLHAYAPLYDPRGVVERASLIPKSIFDGVFAMTEARSLLGLGREALLLDLAKGHGPGLASLKGDCCATPLSLGVPLVIALRRSGRLSEAAALERDLNGWAESSARAGLAGSVFQAQRAELACLAGNADLAAAHLQDAITHGWRGQFGAVPVDLGEDPACESLSGAPRLAAVRARLARLIALERPAVSRSLALAIEWLRKNSPPNPHSNAP